MTTALSESAAKALPTALAASAATTHTVRTFITPPRSLSGLATDSSAHAPSECDARHTTPAKEAATSAEENPFKTAGRARLSPVRSVRMRGVAVATGAEPAIQSAGDFLEEARRDAALGLAQLLLLAGQPCDLDHAAFAFVGQVAVEGIVGALEDHEFAVQRLHFRRDRRVDVVDLCEEP